VCLFSSSNVKLKRSVNYLECLTKRLVSHLPDLSPVLLFFFYNVFAKKKYPNEILFQVKPKLIPFHHHPHISTSSTKKKKTYSPCSPPEPIIYSWQISWSVRVYVASKSLKNQVSTTMIWESSCHLYKHLIPLDNFFHYKLLGWAHCQVNNINREELSLSNVSLLQGRDHYLMNGLSNHCTKGLNDGTEFHASEFTCVLCVHCDSDRWVNNYTYREVCSMGTMQYCRYKFPF